MRPPALESGRGEKEDERNERETGGAMKGGTQKLRNKREGTNNGGGEIGFASRKLQRPGNRSTSRGSEGDESEETCVLFGAGRSKLRVCRDTRNQYKVGRPIKSCERETTPECVLPTRFTPKATGEKAGARKK